MNKQQRPILLIVILVLIVGLIGPAALPGMAKAVHAHPLLGQLATATPDALVAVIVQKAGTSERAEQLTTTLGGVITKDLHIINAFAAEMRAGAALELATSPAVRWVSLDAPTQSAANTKFTIWATQLGTVVSSGFTDAVNIPSPVGRNDTYGYGDQGKKNAFGGFLAEYTPGNRITTVEVALRLYVSKALGSKETPKLIPYFAGKAGTSFSVPVSTINACLASTPCTLYYDITNTRTWKWSDFTGDKLEILIDHAALARGHSIYYDAVGLRLKTEAGSDSTTPLVMASEADTAPVNTSILSNVFQKATRAENIWNESPYWQGSGMTVAVIDSGSFRNNAIGGRLIGEINFNAAEHTNNDQYGHGTFVTGLIADDGEFSAGKYMGIAPRVNILGVRVSDDAGMSTESDVINAMQWVLTNKSTYNIRVVNLSLNSSVWQSYHTSPLDAAAEILWFNGIVVVASAGNNGTATLYPPANDPFVITVGATNDLNTAGLTDDVVASFSAYGTDEAGVAKPDLVAPGTNLIAYLPEVGSLTISVEHAANRVDANYFRMSGTSMSAPLVSGAAAILLQSNPNLTPDQVKYRLMATANKTWPGYNATTAGAGYLDVYAAVKGTTTESANTGRTASQLLWTGSQPITWGSVAWNSVAWNSVAWNSVAWNSVAWNSVAWNSDYWGP